MTDPRDLIRSLDEVKLAGTPEAQRLRRFRDALQAALDELDESERQSDGWRRRCFAAEDARDAALARVAALEDALVWCRESFDAVLAGKPHRAVAEMRAAVDAALAPVEPRTLETDLREDR